MQDLQVGVCSSYN